MRLAKVLCCGYDTLIIELSNVVNRPNPRILVETASERILVMANRCSSTAHLGKAGGDSSACIARPTTGRSIVGIPSALPKEQKRVWCIKYNRNERTTIFQSHLLIESNKSTLSILFT